MNPWNTAEDRKMIAAETVASFGDAFVIETEDELIEVFKEYARRDLADRLKAQGFEPDNEKHVRSVELSSRMYADLNSESFRHDLPAILFLLSRYTGR
jgi:hypothetical protein